MSVRNHQRSKLALAAMVLGAAVLSCASLRASLTGQKNPKPEKLERNRQKTLRKELESAYKTWISEEVPYIITDTEKAAFKNFSTDEEREQFVEHFWDIRNPNPGSGENEFKEEYYRRVAYANERYTSGIPGWTTDRGRIYIMYGPPDEIDPHPSAGTYQRPASEGGGETATFPFEQWTYRYIEGIGSNVVLEFTDSSMSGEYHLAFDPGEKDALTHVPGIGLTQMEAMNMASKADRLSNTNGTTLGQSLGGPGEDMDEFSRLDRFYKIFKAPEPKYHDLRAMVTSRLSAQLLPFDVREDFVPITETSVLMPVTLQVANRNMEFQNKNGLMHAALDVYGQISDLSGRVVSTFEDSVAVDFPEHDFQRYVDNNSAYQKTIPLRPGLYKLTVVVKDELSGRAGSMEVGAKVPSHEEDQLSSSSLILADVIQPLPSRQVGTGPFVIAGMKVRPNVTRIFTRSQNLGLYMKVYNLGIDNKTHQPSAEIQYDIMKDGKTILSEKEQASDNLNASQQITLAKKLPLRSLDPGKYTVQITITDNIKKQTLSPASAFELR